MPKRKVTIGSSDADTVGTALTKWYKDSLMRFLSSVCVIAKSSKHVSKRQKKWKFAGEVWWTWEIKEGQGEMDPQPKAPVGRLYRSNAQ
ncbi:hypothetical protein JTE90_024462 [Oedothorax gibbosus]|uniref:Uncharacterized protein n=1 Tax=Oedothorax gibbosus TaxID=931172 RepID=A0AAV6UHV6_9ARAC|nr:hypothetical protein JTE90_024462 [Oedothorax gibbosus]